MKRLIGFMFLFVSCLFCSQKENGKSVKYVITDNYNKKYCYIDSLNCVVIALPDIKCAAVDKDKNGGITKIFVKGKKIVDMCLSQNLTAGVQKLIILTDEELAQVEFLDTEISLSKELVHRGKILSAKIIPDTSQLILAQDKGTTIFDIMANKVNGLRMIGLFYHLGWSEVSISEKDINRGFGDTCGFEFKESLIKLMDVKKIKATNFLVTVDCANTITLWDMKCYDRHIKFVGIEKILNYKRGYPIERIILDNNCENIFIGENYRDHSKLTKIDIKYLYDLCLGVEELKEKYLISDVANIVKGYLSSEKVKYYW